MRNKLTILFVLLFVALTAFDASAQRRKNKYGYKKSKSQKKFSKYSGGKVGYSGVGNPKYATMGASMNFTNYFGDLSASSSKFSTDYSNIAPDGFGLTMSKVMHPGIFWRVGFNYGNISADDFETDDSSSDDPSAIGRYSRNYHFKNSIYELSAGFEVDMIPSNSGARGRFPVNPYLFVGIAGLYHSPKAQAPAATIDVDGDGTLDAVDQAGNMLDVAPGSWVDLQKLGTGEKAYSKFQFAIPLGLGVKVRLPKNFDLNFEIGFRYLFTDYLDDVGGGYKDLDSFEGNHLARAMSERGAEIYRASNGAERNADIYNTGATNVLYDHASDPNSNWTGENVYTHGDNYVVGGSRGGSANDFYVVTQLRLVYIFDKKGVSKGKFR